MDGNMFERMAKHVSCSVLLTRQNSCHKRGEHEEDLVEEDVARVTENLGSVITDAVV